MKLIVIFILLNIANVIIQTVKSIATIKCGKGLASVINAIAYGLYTVVVVYMVCVVVVILCIRSLRRLPNRYDEIKKRMEMLEG